MVVDVAAAAKKKAERIARKARAAGEQVPTEGHTETVEETTEEETKAAKAPKASPKDKGANVETKKEDK